MKHLTRIHKNIWQKVHITGENKGKMWLQNSQF